MGIILPLFRNIRFYILTFSVVLSVLIFAAYASLSPDVQASRLSQLYALISAAFLYVTLLQSPLYKAFPQLSGKKVYQKASRGLGVSAAYFAVLHVYVAFFFQIGGFPGLGFLPGSYFVSVILSTIALLILLIMAATSFDWAIDKLTFPRWKKIHRWVYLAGVLIVIHAFLSGSHFVNLSRIIPQIATLAVAILLLLEGVRIDSYIQERYTFPRFSLFFVIVACIIVLMSYSVLTGSLGISLNSHANHLTGN